MTYACTLPAVAPYEYEPDSGSAGWSMRSSPHDGGDHCVSDSRTRASCCTYFTAGLAASRRARSAVMVATNPCSAVRYACRTVPPYRPARSLAAGWTPSLSTTMYRSRTAFGAAAPRTVPTGSASATAPSTNTVAMRVPSTATSRHRFQPPTIRVPLDQSDAGTVRVRYRCGPDPPR